MRIVGGRLRGRTLAAPTSQAIRPTADRLREALFNILVHAYGDPITGARVLEHLGLKVSRLIRVSFGPFGLADLASGEIAEVKTRTLREQLGERVIALAGADFSAPMGLQEAPAAPVRPPARRDDKRKRRRVDPERIGQPELARRDKRRGRRPTRGERR